MVQKDRIPAWFDEGLALLLDYRYPHPSGHSPRDYQEQWKYNLRKGHSPIPLQSLQKIDGFFGKGYHHTYFAYLTAGMEVSRWYEKCGQKGLLELIEALKKGNQFQESYLAIGKKNGLTESLLYEEKFFIPFHH